MKIPYGKLLGLAIQLTVLIGALNEGVLTEPESQFDFYLAVITVAILFIAILAMLFFIAEDIYYNGYNKRKKRDED